MGSNRSEFDINRCVVVLDMLLMLLDYGFFNYKMSIMIVSIMKLQELCINSVAQFL